MKHLTAADRLDANGAVPRRRVIRAKPGGAATTRRPIVKRYGARTVYKQPDGTPYPDQDRR